MKEQTEVQKEAEAALLKEAEQKAAEEYTIDIDDHPMDKAGTMLERSAYTLGYIAGHSAREGKEQELERLNEYIKKLTDSARRLLAICPPACYIATGEDGITDDIVDRYIYCKTELREILQS